jgi:hypothetical protein
VTLGQLLRHSCYPAYEAAHRAYAILDSRSDRPRSDQLDHCRSTSWFTRHRSTGQVRVATNACHLRWCPVCARARRNFITHQVSDWLGSADHPKFLTLTISHSDAPLADQIDHLYDSFRALRRRALFKRAVTAGIWFFQIKRSANDHLWHPHLHCLIAGRYISHRVLTGLWRTITHDSSVVDIRQAWDHTRVAYDAARYAASPGRLTDLPLSDRVTLIDAMHGRRICGTWGSARCISLRPTPLTDRSEWERIGSWSTVTNLLSTDFNAQAIFYAWRTNTPLGPGISCQSIDDAIRNALTNNFNAFDLEAVYSEQEQPP